MQEEDRPLLTQKGEIFLPENRKFPVIIGIGIVHIENFEYHKLKAM